MPPPRHRPAPPEALEGRIALSAPDAALQGLELVDASRVRVTYTIVAPASSTTPDSWTLRLYRSADAAFDPSDVPVGEWTVPAAEGDARADGAAVTTTRDLDLDAPFRIEPRRPFVLAAIDPDGAVAESDESNNLAAARRHTIVIVTHGGFQETASGDVPWWQKRLGRELAAQGYDDIFLYNWVGESKIAGALSHQPGRLLHRLGQRLAEAPPGEAVDLHWIGHSQGTVINGLALELLNRDPDPRLAGGVLKATLLDPHAADNGASLRQYSTKPSFMGWVARVAVNDYQGRARDPAPRVPSNVDEAEVFYQHTYYALAPHEEQGWLNLWGHVPVRGEATYTDITGIGISHSGYYSVVDWYREHVLPTLGAGQPPLPPTLTAALAPGSGRVDEVRPARGNVPQSYAMSTALAAPRFEGRSWPGARVRLTAALTGSQTSTPLTLGKAIADDEGVWGITSRDLPAGRYTVVASAVIPASATFPRIQMTPRIRVGQLTVDQPTPTRRDDPPPSR
jgi:hypothetical protein